MEHVGAGGDYCLYPDITRFISRQKVPVVALYADAPHVQVPRVVLDDVRIGQLAAEHFLDRGFADLGFQRFTGYQAVQDREEGFRRAVQQAGRNFHLIDWHGAAQQGRRSNWFDWLQRELPKLPLPIAIMAQSDHRATYLLSVCEAAGLAVPEQAALSGVDSDELIREHFREPLGVEDVIRASHTSRCGRQRAFHKHFGRSVGEEIDRQRVEHAKKLLRETRQKLHATTRLSGFSGAEHFTRTFRRVTGAPSSAYRRQVRSADETS